MPILRSLLDALRRFGAAPAATLPPTPGETRGEGAPRPVDVWERTDHVPCERCFVYATVYDFRAFQAVPSIIPVGTVEWMRHWLSGCEYASDRHLFGKDNYWQSSALFERLRAGDCDDFAAWAWRKLHELGYRDAALVLGWKRAGEEGADWGAHAWVDFGWRGRPHVFDGTLPRDHMARPAEAARGEYYPMFGVDGAGWAFAFGGGLTTGCACVPPRFSLPPALGVPRGPAASGLFRESPC